MTAALVSDTGASATDGITSNAALTGTADPNAAVNLTIDGTAAATPATADASGVWSFTPTGLVDGQHTVVASETNAAGQTGSANLSLHWTPRPPVRGEVATKTVAMSLAVTTIAGTSTSGTTPDTHT